MYPNRQESGTGGAFREYHRFFFAFVPLFLSLSVFFSSTAHPVFTNPVYVNCGDTVSPVKKNERKKRDTSYYMKSKTFYDSIHKKFSRSKVTRLIYNLAFVEPQSTYLPDTVQVLKSTDPYEKFSGKTIRNISIRVLPPFGSSLYDTMAIPFTGIGKALNSIHMNTRKYVIKNNLLFKKGEKVDPSILADNERILRDLSFIDNARILISMPDSCSDTVDLTVITKDVWSIGIDVPVITINRMVTRLYDANFLGMGNGLVANMSLEPARGPLFRVDGLSYAYSNIAGSQINAVIEYYANNEGDRSYGIDFERSFLTNRTKWAGGVGITWYKDINEPDSNIWIASEYKNEKIWGGRAFLLKNKKENIRAVVAIGAYRTKFRDRPLITIDSNRSYYNHFQLLTSFSISKNNYYVTDYVFEFGKTENLPYGHLLQLTLGWDQTDFYDRFYTGLKVSSGRFFDSFGYLAGTVSISGYVNSTSYEDAIVKVLGKYFTPLLRSKNHRYKFRSYLTANYRYAFNLRTNNSDYYDINLDFKVNKINNQDAFEGVHALSAGVSGVCFTPWFLYGFRFALMVNLQAGLVAQRDEALVRAPLFTGIGVGVVIKNDNLVFPAFMIAGFYYPNSEGNLNTFQTYITSNISWNIADYNVTAPYAESLVN